MDKTSLCGEQNIFMPIDKTFFCYRQNYCPAIAKRTSRMVKVICFIIINSFLFFFYFPFAFFSAFAFLFRRQVTWKRA